MLLSITLFTLTVKGAIHRGSSEEIRRLHAMMRRRLQDDDASSPAGGTGSEEESRTAVKLTVRPSLSGGESMTAHEPAPGLDDEVKVVDPARPKPLHRDESAVAAEPKEQTWWEKKKNIFALLGLGSIAIAIGYPYADHHIQGKMNADLVESISGTLATHPISSKLFGTIGTLLSLCAFKGFWDEESKDYENQTEWVNAPSCCKKFLFWTSLPSLLLGLIFQGLLFLFPIGGHLSTYHKYAAGAFGVFTGLGMMLYTRKTSRKFGYNSWRFWLYFCLTLVCVAFVFATPPLKDGQEMMRMDLQTCIDETVQTELCNLSANLMELQAESPHGICRPPMPHYGNPDKLKYACTKDTEGNKIDFKNLDADGAKNACEGLKSSNGESCKWYPKHDSEGNELPENRITGWYSLIGTCENNGKTNPENLACRNVSARDEDGKMKDNFEDECLDVKDSQDNSICDYTDASESERLWTIWGVCEFVAFSSVFLFTGAVLLSC